MTEVLRSKLFYARSALMLAIPTFCHLSDLTKSEQGIVRQLLASASKQTALLSLMASSDAMMTRVMIDAIGRYASQEYFGRAWTLAERMARFGRNEGLCHWLSLESWLGILIKARDSLEEEESTIIVAMLGKAGKIVHSIQRQFHQALELQGVDLSFDLTQKTARLLVAATKRYYRITKGQEEGPSAMWLKRYLGKEVITDVYKAWDKRDLVWAVYSYFFWKEPKYTLEGFEAALSDLLGVA